ncbi:hypothetical protein SZ64_04565 [Erythrobacter sp. SG61-1L]|uniref:hypothetical protein n=1 Tax=Erythrobacter sp. SG61-1L TaxID=1603897 RepID=UPI0006C90D42|nr:hypothetical protein [Erythrobacter sp. SG61-1L]KPL67439.1 hypothetical protein SZ64_04565 [Erythrobacter sp. SG61-1L]
MSGSTTIGEAGEGRDSALPGGAIPGAVPGIDPVDGWVLVEDEEQDGDGFWRPVYDAVRGDERQRLGVSRWRFTPTQARFAWMVRSGFPMMFRAPSGCLAPFHDEVIDAAIAAAALGEAA